MMKLFKITPEYTLLTVAFLITVLFVPITSHALTLTSSSNNVGLNAGLVGWWTFDGKDVVNGRALDKSGNANHGTLTNIASSTFYTTGKIGQGFKFDGSDDYVSVGNNTVLAPTTAVTISAWVKPLRKVDSGHYSAITSRGSVNYLFMIRHGGVVVFYLPGVQNWVTNDGAKDLFDGQWHHALVTYDGSFQRLYIDTTLISSSAITGNITSNSNTTLIGRDTTGASNFNFNGSLDDVRIYNRALSATEVTQLYNQGAATKQGVAQKVTATSTCSTGLSCGLVGYWSFDGKDVVNGRALDKSGSGNHGTLTNISTSTFYTMGKIGQGFRFDGVNDTVNIATNMFANRTEFSLMVWTKKTKGTTGSVFSSSNGGPYWRFTSATTILHYIEKSDCTAGSSRGVAYPDDGKFHYIGFTVSTAGLVRFYVDGVVVDSYTYPSWNYACADATDWRSIGSYAVSNYFNGLLDDVRIYNRALSATEVTQLYNQGSAAKQGVAQKVTATSTCSTGLSCGLVGYWSFDGKDVVNGRALDKSGNANHGTLTNISTSTFYTMGKIGQGFRFDGVDDYINLGSSVNSTLSKNNDFSISAWFKPTTLTSGSYYTILGSMVDANNRTFVGINNSKRVSVGVYDNGVSLGYSNGQTTLSTNVWYHIVMTKSGSTISGYLNGVSFTGTVVQTLSSSVGTTIGARTNLADYFPGLLDDVRVYNRALSATEITQIYNQRK